MSSVMLRCLFASAALLLLAGCQDEASRYPARAYAPIPGDTLSLMRDKGSDRNSPVLLRAYKKESELELWKRSTSGEYVHIKTYPICRWSGQLGPKKKEGDRQVPEGFYSIAASQMNPNSAFWLSFNVGYPNSFERALGRSGGDIMVHGTCSSRGCFAMTNDQIEEIYAVMREAFNGGQKQVQFQSFPFRMTAANLARFRHDPNMPYWKNLKEGSDAFEVTKREPQVAWCSSRYVFNATAENGRLDPTSPCPKLETDPDVAQAVAQKARQDEAQVAELVRKGTPAIRIQYADGSQHMSFRSESHHATAGTDERLTLMQATRTAALGPVSRPEAIGAAEEVTVDETGKPKTEPVKAETSKTETSRSAAASPVNPAIDPAVSVANGAQAYAPAGTKPVKPAEGTSGASLSALTSLFTSAAPDTASEASIPGSTASLAEPPVPDPSLSAAPAGRDQKSSIHSKTDERPFYKRWLGLGASEAASEEPVVVSPAIVPLPPRRGADASAKALPSPQKQAATNKPVSVSQAAVASASAQ